MNPGLLAGPQKIKVSDEQLTEMLSTYQALNNEIQSMLTDFFQPLESLVDEGAFTGKTAEAFTEYCTLLRSYLEARYHLSFEEIKLTIEQFHTTLKEIDQLRI
ncbi:Proteins of 100 residues with WXG [Evansella caseinilytica]|uniref:Proteins of 100 residues with WXG n=1 Tax=Evansella caseinilytica TaxID=1503961 RepID=A0A1H3U3E8_9BACI|nr:WXG100 family type VII secretion target [Evansella caseinilytica]SDZ56996.1 Proteins of 100 residues with WXG [Evansella caseinilytica]